MMKINNSLAGLAGGAALALFAVSGTAIADNHVGTTYKFGGYVKMDAMFSSYSDATPPQNSLIRQFYVPSAISVGDGSGDSDMTADFQARETRLNFRADTTTEGGSTITAFVEMDFFTHGDGNEIVSNSFSPRLRHAFLKFNNWTFGQTWSTFQDVGALPEALDFVGPAESTTFVRQAMIRYTTGNLELAAENPEAFVAGAPNPFPPCPPGCGVNTSRPGYDTIPDLIARYTVKMDGGGYVKVAGLVRSLKLAEDANGSQADATAWGVSVSTKIPFGEGNDIRAMVNYGDGIGRYVGLGFVRDGYVDSVTGDIETAESLSYFVALRTVWSSKWRSNIMYGANSIDYDNDAQAGGLANDSASSIHVNLIRTVMPKLDVGAEIMWAERELVNGTDGDFTRFQLSAKYAF